VELGGLTSAISSGRRCSGPGSASWELLSELLTECSSTNSSPGLFGRISGGSVLEALICDYLHLPGFFGLFTTTDAFASGSNTAVWPFSDGPQRSAAAWTGNAVAARSGGS
jgi:hypothetical protein